MSRYRPGSGAERIPVRPTRWPDQRQSLLRGAIYGLLLLVGVGLVHISPAIVDAINQPVREMRLTGEFDGTKAPEVRVVLGNFAGIGILQVDLARIKAQLELMPWVERATVTRRWPRAIEVQLFEHRLVARWRDGGYLTQSGLVLHGVDGREPLPLVATRWSAPEEILQHFLVLNSVVQSVGLELFELHEGVAGDLTLVLANGIQVQLGNQLQVARIQKFLMAWSSGLGQQESLIERIDMRYVSGFAVRWRNSGSTAVGPRSIGERYGEFAGR